MAVAAMRSSILRPYVAPVGLQGLLMSSALVLGVIRCSSAAGSMAYPSDSLVTRNTGVASFRSAWSEYETQYGVGIMISSPSSSNASARLYSECLAPHDTRI